MVVDWKNIYYIDYCNWGKSIEFDILISLKGKYYLKKIDEYIISKLLNTHWISRSLKTACRINHLDPEEMKKAYKIMKKYSKTNNFKIYYPKKDT